MIKLPPSEIIVAKNPVFKDSQLASPRPGVARKSRAASIEKPVLPSAGK